MRFNTPRDLLLQALRRVDGALIKSDNPYDVGQYVMLKTEGKEFSATVVRNDMSARVSVGNGAPQGLVNIAAPGFYAVDGSRFVQALAKHELQVDAEVDFKPTGPKQTRPAIIKGDPDENDQARAELEIGSLRLFMAGSKGEKEEYGFQCVNLAQDPKFNGNPETKVVVQGRDLVRFVKELNMSVGKATGRSDLACIRIKVKGKNMELATTNGMTCGVAQFGIVSAEQNMEVLAPYEALKGVVKMLDVNQDVSIYVNDTEPRTLIISQDVVHSGIVVGECTFKITEAAEKFPSVESLFGSLSFKYSCKIKRSHLKICCDKLANIDVAKTLAIFDPDKLIARFEKQEPGSAALAKPTMPIFDPQGERFEIEISSRHLQNVADYCEEEDLEIKFSGKRSMAALIAGPHMTMYFAPFGM